MKRKKVLCQNRISWPICVLTQRKGDNTMKKLKFCVEFALANRKLMMERIASVLEEETHCGFISWEGTRFINIAHNYAAERRAFWMQGYSTP